MRCINGTPEKILSLNVREYSEKGKRIFQSGVLINEYQESGQDKVEAR